MIARCSVNVIRLQNVSFQIKYLDGQMKNQMYSIANKCMFVRIHRNKIPVYGVLNTLIKGTVCDSYSFFVSEMLLTAL